LNCDLKHTFFLGGSGATEGDRASCLILQADGYFFEGMCQAGRVTWSGTFERSHCWKNATQLFFKIIAGQHLAFMGLTADDGFDAGLSTP
jgi:hypothetical protein